MPTGDNPNSRANLKAEPRNFTTEEAKKGARNSAIKRRENKIIREEILKRMKESDWQTIIENAIKRAQETDKGFEVWRDTLGQKPIEQVQQIEIPKIVDDV